MNVRLHTQKQRMIMSLWLAGGAMMALVGAYVFAGKAGYLPYQLLADPAAVYKLPIFTGIVSQLGIYLLLITAAVCGFAGQFQVEYRKRLIAVAILSFVLAFDDQYLIHERVAPRQLGVSEQMLMLYYGLFALGILYQFGRKVFEPPQWPLLLAGGMLFVSIVVDNLGLGSGGLVLVIEDFAKLSGYALWSAFWIVFGSREIRKAMVQSNLRVE